MIDTEELSEWLLRERNKGVEKIRLRFDANPPEIGERCVFKMKNYDCVYFGYRMSLNFYKSGSSQIKADDVSTVVTLKEVEDL